MNANAYQALRERAAWIDSSGRGKIRVTGEDRVRLLHAMCTNHVESLQPGAGCYAFFLNAQGRILADAYIFCLPDYLLLDTEPESRARLMEHLDKFIIADDVTLHDFTAGTATVYLEGPAAEQVLCDLGAMPAHIPCSLVEWAQSLVAHTSYTGGPGYAIFVPREQKADLIAQLQGAGVPQADLATADLVRLENGRPRFGVDFSDANIPQETRQMQAVHFQKGCYLGQEIVERVRSRGHVNRLLTPIEVQSEEPLPPGTKVLAAGKEVGAITGSAFSPARGCVAGLAILRAEALQERLEAAGRTVIARERPAPNAG